MIKPIDKKYRAYITSQPCAKCGFYRENYIAFAHQRILGGGGTGMKPHDKDGLPLCTIPERDCHREEHKGAVTFWEQGDKASTKLYVQNKCNEYINEYLKEINYVGNERKYREI